VRCPYPDYWITTQPVAKTPQTLGEHIKKRRLELRLLQSQAAAGIGVSTATLQNWERGVGFPIVRQWPAIIKFLGYDPEPEPIGIPARIAYARRRLGWTQEELAERTDVDPVTVYRWEKAGSAPSPETISKIQEHLGTTFRL